MSDRRLWLIVLGLSLGPAVSNGFARFAYGLMLPAMREDLGWSFTEAGWINTANAIGYLLGALLAFSFIGRVGARLLFIGGLFFTIAPLILSALTRDFFWLSVWRVIAGIGGAPVFIAGGVMATTLWVADKSKNALAIAVYFGGGGLGMAVTGPAIPYLLEWRGAAVWPLGWLIVGLGGVLCFLPAYFAAAATPEPRRPKDARRLTLPYGSMSSAIAAYFMFGLGYTAYITFLVAWMREDDADTALIAGTWVLIGCAVMVSPFLWRGVLAKAAAGGAIALTLLATGIGAGLPLFWQGIWGVLASAVLFGGSFFMVPTAATTFARKNLPEESWGAAVSLLTVAFSIGQIIGPTAAGAIADISGGVTAGLTAGAVVLGVGCLTGMAQRTLIAPAADASTA